MHQQPSPSPSPSPTTPSMMPPMSSFPPSATITTEQIQKCLDENKKLILAIMENQNLGKLAECAQYQAQLQKNLMHLAAIADAQPQMPTMPAQVATPPAMQQGSYYMQQQAAAMAQPQGAFPPRMPTQFAGSLQLHDQQQRQLHQQPQQAIPGQLNFRTTGPNNGMHPMQTGNPLGGGGSEIQPTSAGAGDARGGNKQDGAEAASRGGAHGSSARDGEADTSYLQRGSEE